MYIITHSVKAPFPSILFTTPVTHPIGNNCYTCYMTIKAFHLVRTSLLFFLLFQNSISCQTFAQTKHPYTNEVENKIKQVENNLAPWAVDQNNLRFTIADRMANYNIHGLSIVMIKDYKIEWVKAYGWADVTAKRPVTTETLFQAGSISKSLNGVGILKLVQDKELDLYTDINNYLTTWRFPYDSLSKNKIITTANLLSHTGGLGVHGFAGYTSKDPMPSIKEILDGKNPANSEAVRSTDEPGKTAEYSGGGIIISQLILTDITHEKYEDYMWRNVLRPLGMKNSFFTQPAAKYRNLIATGYSLDGKELLGGKYNIYPELAAAGLWTTPTDLAKYIIETQLSLKGKSNKVLSQELTKLRLTPYIDNESALGVFVTIKGTDKYFGHTGGTSGFISEYIGSFENGNGVVVMTNSGNPGISSEIINSVAEVYKWNNFYNPDVKKSITLPNDILENYVGEYSLNGQSIFIVKKQNELWLSSAIQSKMYFTNNSDFYITEKQADYKFTKGLNGAIDGFTDKYNRKAKRIK